MYCISASLEFQDSRISCRELQDGWDQLVSKEVPKSMPSLLQLKQVFENLHLENAECDQKYWISKLEGIHYSIENVDSLEYLMSNIINDLPPQ